MPSTMIVIIYLVVMLGIFYLALWLPESRRRKKFKKVLDALKVNDEVVTRGGILGKIVNLQEDFVIIQTGPDKVRIKIEKNAIANVQARKAQH